MTDDTPEVECKTLKEMLLYKMDRNLAVIGAIAIGLTALWIGKGPEAINIAALVAGGLVSFLGSRSGK
jgi:hypothetical protein